MTWVKIASMVISALSMGLASYSIWLSARIRKKNRETEKLLRKHRKDT